MPTLREPFDTIHQRELKNKKGEVVARLDYIEWAQAATRLDEAEEVARWSFSVMALGPDWCHGRLTLTGPDGIDRYFENVGYAENADAEWKKEPLKDAVSDALKRCAAMAGVARYLYETEQAPRPVERPRTAPPRPSSAPTPIRSSTHVPEPVDPIWDGIPVAQTNGHDAPPMTSRELFSLAESAGLDKRVLTDASKRMYGSNAWKITELTNDQRAALAEELSLVPG